MSEQKLDADVFAAFWDVLCPGIRVTNADYRHYAPAIEAAVLRAERPGWAEAIEAAAKALDEWADDLAHTRDQYIDAHTSGTFNGRRIDPKQARAHAHDFGERSSAVSGCVDILRALHPSVAEGRQPKGE